VIRPTPDELISAEGRSIPEVIGQGIRYLFVGINPGLWSGATGHHFARPGNRFWPTLHGAGFTPRQLAPDDDTMVVALGIGITNLVNRTTAKASQVSDDELRAGATRLRETVRRSRPAAVAILGGSAYRGAFGAPPRLPVSYRCNRSAACFTIFRGSSASARWSRPSSVIM